MNMPYKVEDLKFFNMKKKDIWVSSPYMRNGLKIFELEDQLSEDEKLAFIDEMKEGIGTYLLNILKRWESEKDSLPKDQYGHPKTVSKKAWIKRNDPHKIIDITYTLGKYHLFGRKFLEMSTICPSTDYGYSMEYTGKFVVHQWFHDLCQELYYQEKKHFEAHDTKEIKLKEVRELGHSYGVIFDNQTLNDIVWNSKKDVTEEELDAFIAAYKELEEKIQEISKKLETVTS